MTLHRDPGAVMTPMGIRTDPPAAARCRVSVIIPVYNGEAFVGEAVRSALNQTERHIEVIVVDDASTDHTVECLTQLAREDARVRVLCLAHNTGPSAARNAALHLAVGTWIATLDADDQFDPDRLKLLLAAADRHGADMVSDNVLVCPKYASPYSLISPQQLAYPRQLSMVEFVLGNAQAERQLASYGFLQPIIRHDFLQRHQIRYAVESRFGEDFILYMHCLRAGARWWMLPDALYIYAVRPGSLTQVQTAADLRRIEDLDTAMLRDPALVADTLLCRALLRHRRKIRRLQRYREITDAMKQGRLAEALRLLHQDPQTPVLVAIEATRQLPNIARKALRGGYRSPPQQFAAPETADPTPF